MRTATLCLLALAGCAVAAGAQANHKHYVRRAKVVHQGSSAVVEANDPRPLLQAITAVREEYGWEVDYEDPPYSGTFDLVRDASMCRQPCGEGFLIPAGGAFQSTYPETPHIWSSPNEELQILDKIVSDYDATQNPGKFEVIQQSNGSYAVVGEFIEDDSGTEVPVHRILDTRISLATATRSAAVTIGLIQDALSKASGTDVGSGTGAINVLLQSQVTVGGNDVPARDLLLQTIDQIKLMKLAWDFLYDADGKAYYLNFGPVERVSNDAFGRRTTTIIQ
jgi:hypothetical protein